MVSGARWLFLAMVWIYLAAILYQVFLAGIGLFGAARDFEPHVGLGWILHIVPVLLLIVAAVGRVGRQLMWWTTALLVVQFIQPLLALARNDQPLVAALHPVLALVIFWLGITVGLQAWRLVREPAPLTEQDR
jgi:Zn-dependent protease with chaperone function